MAKFLVIWRQAGGCDYTIGCGISVDEIEAPDLDAARASVIQKCANPEEMHDEEMRSMRNVEIHELAGPNCRVDDAHWGEPRRAAQDARRKAEQDEKDRAEFERLQKKFKAKS